LFELSGNQQKPSINKTPDKSSQRGRKRRKSPELKLLKRKAKAEDYEETRLA